MALHPQIEKLYRESMNYWGLRGQLAGQPSMAMDSAPRVDPRVPRTAAEGAAYGRAMAQRILRNSHPRGMAFDAPIPGALIARAAQALKSALPHEDLAQLKATLEDATEGPSRKTVGTDEDQFPAARALAGALLPGGEALVPTDSAMDQVDPAAAASWRS